MWKLRIYTAQDFPSTVNGREVNLSAAFFSAMREYNSIANYYNTEILGFATPASDAHYRAVCFLRKEKVEALYWAAANTCWDTYQPCEE